MFAKTKLLVLSVFILIVQVGCSLGDDNVDYSADLTGKISGTAFTYSKAFFSAVSSTYQIDIWGAEGSALTTNTSSSYDIYPYIEFSIPNTITSATYDVAISGTSTILVTCWSSAFSGSWLDSGTLEITKDSESQMTVVFKNCVTTDGSCVLTGTCIINKW
jgi:hypothetical protein